MAARKNRPAKSGSQKEVARDIAATYNEFKEYEGQKYTGMKIGRSHKWYYDQGEWKEKKITPDLWQIDYAVVKRPPGGRRKAPACRLVRSITGISWRTRMCAS